MLLRATVPRARGLFWLSTCAEPSFCRCAVL